MMGGRAGCLMKIACLLNSVDQCRTNRHKQWWRPLDGYV